MTEQMTKRKSKGKKIAAIVLGVLVVLVVVVLCVFYGMFHRELATIRSIEKESENYYVMDYQADYGLDEFLEQGASRDADLAAFIIQKLMKGLPVEISLPDFGCSTFNAVTPEGEALFGRNFDNPEAVYALVHTDPEGGYESISMVNLTYVGYGGDYRPEGLTDSLLALAAPYIPLDGLNEAGLSIGVLQLDTPPTAQDTGKVDITTTSAIRMILDKAATVDEAIALLQQYDMHSSANASYHFQIADANGDSATVEYIDQVMNVLRPEDGSQVTTNFILSEGPYYNQGGGQDRYETLVSGLGEKNGVVTEEEAMDLLSRASQNKTKEDGTWLGTLWSCVYNNTDRTLQLCLECDYSKVMTYSVDWD